jgi:hypothetical protein
LKAIPFCPLCFTLEQLGRQPLNLDLRCPLGGARALARAISAVENHALGWLVIAVQLLKD